MAAKDATQVAREYITKLASKTVSTTLEKIKSKTTKKKESTEELSSIKAPNGTYYTKNDIDYLTSQGYTQDAAIAELATADKYKSDQTKQGQAQQQVTEAKQENSLQTRQAAKELVTKKIDEMLGNSLKNLMNNIPSSNLSDTVKTKVQATIQTYAGLQITNSPAITNAISKVETELTNFLTKQTAKMNGSSDSTDSSNSTDGSNTNSTSTDANSTTDANNTTGTTAENALSSCTNIQGLNGKVGELLKNQLNNEQIKSTLLKSISSSLQNCTALNDLLKNANANINTSDIAKNLKINTADISKTLSTTLSSVSTTVDKVLKNSKLDSSIQTNISNSFKVAQSVLQSEETQQKYQEQLNNLISNYTSQAATYAQNYTNQLKTALASKVSIKF